jgi:hypothetical protein
MDNYPNNLKDWIFSVTRRYYFGELSQDIIDHLRAANFKFCKYKKAAFNQLDK